MALPSTSTTIGSALHWSRGAPIDRRAIAVAALGMAVPAVLGVALGRPETGFTIGLGAMLLAGGATSGSAVAEPPSPASAIVPAMLAVGVAAAIAGTPWSDAAMVALAAAAATISGYSRPTGVAAIRFVIYLVLSLGLIESAVGHHGDAALVFGLGAVWNVAIRIVLDRRIAPPAAARATSAAPARTPTTAQRRAHWRRTLRTLDGWQFTVRLGAGLGIACLLRAAWPGHHGGWIVLTVALLTQRPLEHLPVKTIQRTVGTLVGVGLTWVILAVTSAPVAIAGVICLLATAAPLAKARSYLAYSVLSTPVILLVLDLGKPIATSLLADRLLATLAGAAIVVAANVVVDRILRATRATA